MVAVHSESIRPCLSLNCGRAMLFESRVFMASLLTMTLPNEKHTSKQP